MHEEIDRTIEDYHKASIYDELDRCIDNIKDSIATIDRVKKKLSIMINDIDKDKD